MEIAPGILKTLEEVKFRVSTDTRKELSGTIYFGLKGETFDGNTFIAEALEKGATAAVTDDPNRAGEKVYVVKDVLQTLQEVAKKYRETFAIPIIAIGGSNGKTTTRELVAEVLRTTYKTHSSKENLNNHIGLPLSILSMSKDVEVGVFEIGANHPGEHIALLDILQPTLVLVTNNGLDHLEGFGSAEGVRKANKEVYDWASSHSATALVDKDQPDLVEDSEKLKRTLYPRKPLEVKSSLPLTFIYRGETHVTHLVGDYNLANIAGALAVGEALNVPLEKALQAISAYEPSLKRSQYMEKDGMHLILDCYNANPSSMKLSLESFLAAAPEPRGVVLGDMLELGPYAETEHEKIVQILSTRSLNKVIFIGPLFKTALASVSFPYEWFPDALEAQAWIKSQNFEGWYLLLKGSRGMKVEKIVGL